MTPLILSTWSFGQRGNAAAWDALRAGGNSIDAVETVCRTVDDDPEIDSVGYGGLPDHDGRMSLDGCIMLSPARCGSVCAVRRHRHPVSIARLVMQHTPHIMLTGPDADDFADAHGEAEEPLLSDDARRAWEQWKRNPRIPDQSRDGAKSMRPVDQTNSGRLFTIPDDERQWVHHDTIGTLGLDARGVIAGACSTSGTPFKTPGRVGDSPIIGHGLYVHPDYGAAVATGTGELVMSICGTFLAVELIRRGASPNEAIEEVLARIADEHELRDEHQVGLIALRPDGAFATGALRGGYRTSVITDDGPRVVEPDIVHFARSGPKPDVVSPE